MAKLFAAAATVALLATSAHAQVVRCTDPTTGKTTYSDTPCGAREQQRVVATSRTATAQEQAAAHAESQRLQRINQRAAAAYRSMAPEPAQVVVAAPNRPADTAACKRSLHELNVYDNTRNKRSDGAAQRAAVRANCDVEMPEPRPKVIVVAPPTSGFVPRTITHCDAQGGCYASDGAYLPPGRCRRQGNMVQCD